jgi:hypothetical protein
VLPCHSVQSVMSGPVPRRLGPHSDSVLSRFPLFIYSTCFWVLGPRFSTVAPKRSCYPVRTLIAVCCVVSTLLCCLKHRRHHIVMQSLCFANGAIATEQLSSLHATFRKVVTGTGASGGTRTPTPKDWNLNPARLPITPQTLYFK